MELKEELIAKIRHMGEEVKFNMGDVLFKEGEKADMVYIILNGHASIFKKSPGEEEVFVGIAGAGSVIGEMGLFLEGERTATVRAASNITALSFSNEQFLKAVSEVPELAYLMLKGFSKRVHNLNRRIINITISKLMYPIGMYLLENVKMEESPYYKQEEGTVEMHIKKLAAEYGIEVSKIESVINILQKAGVLYVERTEPLDVEGKEEVVYVLRLNPEKLRSYLRSVAYV